MIILKFAKGIGKILRFIYGFLNGYIFISIIYITIALTVIVLKPYEFNLLIIKYIKTSEYNKLDITIPGYLLMCFFGFYEVKKLERQIKRKRKSRRKNNG